MSALIILGRGLNHKVTNTISKEDLLHSTILLKINHENDDSNLISIEYPNYTVTVDSSEHVKPDICANFNYDQSWVEKCLKYLNKDKIVQTVIFATDWSTTRYINDITGTISHILQKIECFSSNIRLLMVELECEPASLADVESNEKINNHVLNVFSKNHMKSKNEPISEFKRKKIIPARKYNTEITNLELYYETIRKLFIMMNNFEFNNRFEIRININSNSFSSSNLLELLEKITNIDTKYNYNIVLWEIGTKNMMIYKNFREQSHVKFHYLEDDNWSFYAKDSKLNGFVGIWTSLVFELDNK